MIFYQTEKTVDQIIWDAKEKNIRVVRVYMIKPYDDFSEDHYYSDTVAGIQGLIWKDTGICADIFEL